MCFVESVSREDLDIRPDPFTGRLLDPVSDASVQELGLILLHHLGQLLTHRLPDPVRLTERKAGEISTKPLDLLLVSDDPVGFLQSRPHLLVVIDDLLFPVLPRDIVRDILHRARPIQCVHRDNVADLVGQELRQVALHPGALELEHTRGVSSPKQLIRFRIV